ncbi:hypothetical protein [Sulfurimonas sp. CS5]|uniref:hypothetical protein n=1 Tax=Sulfurimonas sp. CS5 TaxID=3391145 RepID=UPI0039E8BFAB
MKSLSNAELKAELNKILTYGNNDITIDSESIEILSNNKDLIVMSTAECSGCDSACEVIKLAIEDLELEKLYINNADSVLLYFKINPNFNLKKLLDAIDIVHSLVSEETDVIFGTSCDENSSEDYVKVTVFLSYLQKLELAAANNYIEKLGF